MVRRAAGSRARLSLPSLRSWPARSPVGPGPHNRRRRCLSLFRMQHHHATKKGCCRSCSRWGWSRSRSCSRRRPRRSPVRRASTRGAHAPSLGHGLDAAVLRRSQRVARRIRAFALAARAAARGPRCRASRRSATAIRSPLASSSNRARRLHARLRAQPGAGRRIGRDARCEQEQRVARAHRATTEKLAQFVSRKLDDVDLVAMFIDGIEFAGHSVRHRSRRHDRRHQGRSASGPGRPRTRRGTELLSNLVASRSSRRASMLFVIDGGKAIAKRCASLRRPRNRAALPGAQGSQRSRSTELDGDIRGAASYPLLHGSAAGAPLRADSISRVARELVQNESAIEVGKYARRA